MDVLFIIDSSGSVTQTFRDQLSRANRIVDRMIIGPNNARVGLIIFADPGRAKLEFPFNAYATKVELQAGIAQTKYIGGTTGAADALQLAAQQLAPG